MKTITRTSFACAALLTASLAFAADDEPAPNPGPGPGGQATYTQCYEYAKAAHFYFEQYLHWSARCISSGTSTDCELRDQAYNNWHIWWGRYFHGKCFGYPLQSPPNPWSHDPDRPMDGNP